MTPLQAAGVVVAALCATAVVATRDPRRQVLVFGIYGSVLGIVFFTFNAPDVGLAEVNVSTVVVPLIVVLALAKVGRPDGETKDRPT